MRLTNFPKRATTSNLPQINEIAGGPFGAWLEVYPIIWTKDTS